MTIEKSILKVIPGLQATALLGKNLKAVPKFNMKSPDKKISKPAKPLKNIVKLGAVNLAGIGLISATSSEINKLP